MSNELAYIYITECCIMASAGRLRWSGLPNERFCIVKEDMWQVYYSERGKKAGQKLFETEEEACEYFYEKMKRYSTI